MLSFEREYYKLFRIYRKISNPFYYYNSIVVVYPTHRVYLAKQSNVDINFHPTSGVQGKKIWQSICFFFS